MDCGWGYRRLMLKVAWGGEKVDRRPDWIKEVSGRSALWASGLAPLRLSSPPFGQIKRKHFLALGLVAATTGAAEILGFKAENGCVDSQEGIMWRKHLLYIKTSF